MRFVPSKFQNRGTHRPNNSTNNHTGACAPVMDVMHMVGDVARDARWSHLEKFHDAGRPGHTLDRA